MLGLGLRSGLEIFGERFTLGILMRYSHRVFDLHFRDAFSVLDLCYSYNNVCLMFGSQETS